LRSVGGGISGVGAGPVTGGGTSRRPAECRAVRGLPIAIGRFPATSPVVVPAPMARGAPALIGAGSRCFPLRMRSPGFGA
jgi:hypothetical protein